MATLLYRLGRTAFRRWPVFVAAWLIALIGIGVVATSISKPMVDSFSIPGIPSLKAQDLQKELFPGTPDAQDQASVTVVVAAPKGHTLREEEYAAKVDALVADLSRLTQMPRDVRLVNPVRASDAQYQRAVSESVKGGTPEAVAQANARALLPLSADSRTGTITWTFAVKSVGDVTTYTRDTLLSDLADARASGLDAQVNGSGMQAVPET
ncbi:MAG: rane protein, partial [Marmoricola sp.]|nr:rane protein [Marmoricola sp.]